MVDEQALNPTACVISMKLSAIFLSNVIPISRIYKLELDNYQWLCNLVTGCLHSKRIIHIYRHYCQYTCVTRNSLFVYVFIDLKSFANSEDEPPPMHTVGSGLGYNTCGNRNGVHNTCA